MGLVPTYKMPDVKAYLAEQAKKIDKAIIVVLSYLGEQCVNHARTLDTYRDQTGNLRSSIGYVIVKNGEVVKRNFGKSGRGKKASSVDGVKTGEELAIKLADDIGQGWGLIVVAGMNYALSVESRGLDVLSSAELLAKTELPRMIKQLSGDITASIR